ncbi:hypothetical protein M885DRAFT_549392 [Pelagophyceae sp. CCMP2097]|nr:hypothetical protein M885DRAFT_549392 [Pelagophyceae sp. CCMP2097]
MQLRLADDDEEGAGPTLLSARRAGDGGQVSSRRLFGLILAHEALNLPRISSPRADHQRCGLSQQAIRQLPQSTAGVQPERSADGDDDGAECAICLSNAVAGETWTTLPCLHAFHSACIEDWFKRATTCPTCKRDVADAIRNTP